MIYINVKYKESSYCTYSYMLEKEYWNRRKEIKIEIFIQTNNTLKVHPCNRFQETHIVIKTLTYKQPLTDKRV